MKRISVVAAAGLIVGACTQPDGSTALGVPGSPAWMMTASPEAKMATYQGNCRGYGFTPGTIEMAQCMQTEAGDHRANASANMAAMSEGMVEASQPQPMPTMTTTNCNTYGGSTRCTSY